MSKLKYTTEEEEILIGKFLLGEEDEFYDVEIFELLQKFDEKLDVALEEKNLLEKRLKEIEELIKKPIIQDNSKWYMDK